MTMYGSRAQLATILLNIFFYTNGDDHFDNEEDEGESDFSDVEPDASDLPSDEEIEQILNNGNLEEDELYD